MSENESHPPGLTSRDREPPDDTDEQAPRQPPGRARRFGPDHVSAWAAVGGVVVAALALWLGTRGDEPAAPGGGGVVEARVGHDRTDYVDLAQVASGKYWDLKAGETIIYMVQDANLDSEDDPWVSVFATRTPAESVNGRESGQWESRVPLADKDQRLRSAVGIAPEVTQGVTEGNVLDEISANGPTSPLLSDVVQIELATGE